MASITLRGVHKRFGDTPVVRGVDLALIDGEFVVLVGPSGCGKSTLLRMIAGLEDISEGELLIDDRVVNRLSPAERDVAMVFQSYALYPHMTVADNMGFGLSVRGVAKDEIRARVAAAARSLGIDGLLGRYPRELSGGQRQRVAMGRALVRKPRVYLFDEPLSNLDAALRAEVRVELKRLHQETRVTSVYVTHDQMEALTLADRIVVLHQGVVQQVGTPDELFHRPANRFVAGFIGSPPMNFIEARVADGALRAVGLRLPWTWSATVAPRAEAVVIGIRPHDATPAPEGAATLWVKVDVVEALGWEAVVHAHLVDENSRGGAFAFRVEGEAARAVKPGEWMGLVVDPARVHVFHAATGARIDGGGVPLRDPGAGI